MNTAPKELPLTPRQSPLELEGPANDLERRRDLGQFFTSPAVGGFIWDFLEVIHGSPFPANTRVIDPACGEGVFLQLAHQRCGLALKCLFGADIDETLAPGWRQDPMLRDANLFSANGLLDDPQTGILEGTFDIVAGNPPFSGRGLRDLLRLVDDSQEGFRHQEKDFFETSCLEQQAMASRPSLTNGERAQLDRVARALSQYSCWRLDTDSATDDEVDDQSGNAPPGLFSPSVLFDRPALTPSDFERAAQLIDRWPLDRPLDHSHPDVRAVIRRLASTAIEVVFTERFVRLAKPGGLIAVIVPESIVASDRLGPLRVWLLGQMDLLASISLPQKVFTGVGANAKTSIIFARRRTQDGSDASYSREAAEDLAEQERPIFLAAPRLDAPRFSIENYLARVLTEARTERDQFWSDVK